VLGAIVSTLLAAFVIGLLARWSVPGPDPMPIWMTTGFGLVGALIGNSLASPSSARASTPARRFRPGCFSVLAATGLVDRAQALHPTSADHRAGGAAAAGQPVRPESRRQRPAAEALRPAPRRRPHRRGVRGEEGRVAGASLGGLGGERGAAAWEVPPRGKAPVVGTPDIGLDEERVRARLVDVQAARFAAPVRAAAGRDRGRSRRSRRAGRCGRPRTHAAR